MAAETPGWQNGRIVLVGHAALTACSTPVILWAVAKHGAHAALRIAIGARPVLPFWDVKADELAEGLSRWVPRVHGLDPEADLAIIERLGALWEMATSRTKTPRFHRASKTAACVPNPRYI